MAILFTFHPGTPMSTESTIPEDDSSLKAVYTLLREPCVVHLPSKRKMEVIGISPFSEACDNPMTSLHGFIDNKPTIVHVLTEWSVKNVR